jgi:cytoskeletal protein RodZ
VTLEIQRLRGLGGAGVARPPFARLLVAAAVGVLGVGSGPAAAQGSGPEKPPVKAPVRLSPEPAPVAKATAPTTVSTSTPATSASRTSPATTPPPAVAVTTTKAAQAPRGSAEIPSPKPPPPAPAKPKAKQAVQSLAQAVQRSTTRIAVGAAPAGSSGWNRLLFLGGVALLVLVLGDAAFIAFAARVLREPAER